MNSLVRDQFEVLHQTQVLIPEFLNTLSDSDLDCQLPGANPSLRQLCQQQVAFEEAYIDSFRTFKLTFDDSLPDTSVTLDALKAAFRQTHQQLDAVLSELAEEDIQGKPIDRGWPVPVTVNLHIYREAILIFGGKVSTYLRALNKPLPEQFSQWIG